MRRTVVMLVLLIGVAAAHAAGGLDIYFVRHAETLANVTGEHNSGTSNLFSERGDAQVCALTGQLQKLRFDAILVSPAERALNTILPYLKKSGQQGEIWPEINECCWQKDRGNLTKGELITSSSVHLSKEQEPHFTFRNENAKHQYANNSYADGVVQVRQAQQLLQQHYFGSGKTILIVAHYHSGQVLLAELLGISRDELPGLENGKLTHLHQGDDGRFVLLSINGREMSPKLSTD